MAPHYRGDWRPWFDARMMIHFQLTSILGGLGFILLLPGDTFASTAAWRFFASVAPENVWAGVFLIFACVGAMGLTTANRFIRIASIFLIATIHAIMAAFFLAGNPGGGASWTYANIAFAGFYLAWRQAVGVLG